MDFGVLKRARSGAVLLAGALALLAVCALPAQQAFAATVEVQPSSNDRAAIQKVLDAGDSVKLVSGETYHTNGNLYVSSNATITATGATVKCTNGAFRNKVVSGKYSYNSLTNFTVIGGTWVSENANGYDKSMIQFTHAGNITLDGVTAEANFEGHAAEFIACKNVTVKNCTLRGVGSKAKNSVEEQLQFDIASPSTAPTIKSEFGAKAVAGQTCQNIVVKDSTISGCRGLTTNYTHDSKYKNKCHKNISVTNCKITGVSSEAMALFNVIGKVTVKNNTIISTSSRTGTAYSVGCHIAMFGKAAKKAMKSTKVTVSGNTIKGGRQGVFVCSHTSSKYGKVTLSKNKAYCKKGKKNAVKIASKTATKQSISKNKTYKWK